MAKFASDDIFLLCDVHKLKGRMNKKHYMYLGETRAMAELCFVLEDKMTSFVAHLHINQERCDPQETCLARSCGVRGETPE